MIEIGLLHLEDLSVTTIFLKQAMIGDNLIDWGSYSSLMVLLQQNHLQKALVYTLGYLSDRQKIAPIHPITKCL